MNSNTSTRKLFSRTHLYVLDLCSDLNANINEVSFLPEVLYIDLSLKEPLKDPELTKKLLERFSYYFWDKRYITKILQSSESTLTITITLEED